MPTDVLMLCEVYDRELGSKGLQDIKLCLSQASSGLAQCAQVQETMSEWWLQPAQHSVPWVTYEGMSCDKWIDQWRVLTAKHRQLQHKQ